MAKTLKITLPDGRTFEMPDNDANRRYYERMNERDVTGQRQVQIEVLAWDEASTGSATAQPVATTGYLDVVQPIGEEKPTVVVTHTSATADIQPTAQPAPRPRQVRQGSPTSTQTQPTEI